MKRLGRPPIHGKTNTKTFRIWSGMKTRCLNPNDGGFKKYGARGIKICKRWLTFTNFLADMGECPKGFSIERIDNDGHYCPQNCKWIPMVLQANNKQNSVVVTVNGETDCVSFLARKYGKKPTRILRRLALGWSVEDAFFLGIVKHGPHAGQTLKERQK